jgi:hypothetical protein
MDPVEERLAWLMAAALVWLVASWRCVEVWP